MANANNILIGAANVLIDGADIGYTQGGTVVRYEAEAVSVDADQAVGTVRKGRSMEKMFVVVNMLEISYTRLRQAFMFPVANFTNSTLYFGYNGSCWTDEVEITLTGPSPGCGTRTFVFYRCISFEGTKEYAMKKDEATVFEVEFECLKNTSGKFGYSY